MTEQKQPTLTLNDGRVVPQLGFGTYLIENDDAEDAVNTALDIGYKLVDTAAVYRNEKGVGAALQDKPDIWLTTKIWNEQQGYDEAKTAFDKSLGRLGRDDVDLLLIHWPCPDQGKYVDTWKAFVDLQKEGRAKSIGVSNFMPDHLEKIIDATGVVPAVNQIELHPRFQQRELRDIHKKLGIVTQGWSPLGQGDAMDNDNVKAIAEDNGMSPAQVVLNWHLQNDIMIFPKASSKEHQEDNFGALKYSLTDEQMEQIDALDSATGRIGPNPNEFS